MRKGLTRIANKMLVNACSITLIGVNFKRVMVSSVLVKERFRDALYDEVKDFGEKSGLDQEDLKDSLRNIPELLQEIKDFELLGNLKRSKKNG